MREEVLYKVFLDLQKAYGSLYRESFMEILVGYNIGPQTERVIRIYWDHLLVGDQVGLYYGTPFQGSLGFTQGDPLSPTILTWWWMTW